MRTLLAAAQITSIPGDLGANIVAHASAIVAAARHGVSLLVFPELSLMGYEPHLAGACALGEADPRLDPLRALVQSHRIEAVLGAALTSGSDRPFLGAIVLSPDGSTRTYRKMHLGGQEPHHFTPGDAPLMLRHQGHGIGLAICADASQPAHPQNYADAGADVYAAGVFLNQEWHATDMPRLRSYAVRHRLLVLMANHGASVGTYTSVGGSAAWDPEGRVVAEVKGQEDALVIVWRDNQRWWGRIESW